MVMRLLFLILCLKVESRFKALIIWLMVLMIPVSSGSSVRRINNFRIFALNFKLIFMSNSLINSSMGILMIFVYLAFWALIMFSIWLIIKWLKKK